MGFNFENDKSKNDDQMSLFDFQMPKADFANSSQKSSAAQQSAIDYDAFLLAHREPEQSKTSRFLTLSATLHAAIILVVAMITVPLVEEVKTETITIEIEDVPKPKIAARGARVPPTQGGLPVAADTPQVDKLDDAGSPGDVVIAKPKAASKTASKAAKKAPAKAAKAPAKAQAVAAKGGRSIAPKTEFKAVPMTIDDIEAPELDEGALAKHAVASNMNADFNEDFDNIDSAQGAAVDSERRSMDALAAAMAAEQDESLNALDADNQAEADKLAAMQNEMRQRNAKAISSALANERAAALAAAAAKEKAARDAAAKHAGLGGEGNGRGMGKGAGAGNSGSPGQGTALAGEPNGVRSLDQLRQMPGNPRPRYDRQERLRGDQGAVVFYAYITKEGYPQKFRMMQSTGFRNLDSKTLAALKKWRFYPGQQGWVELPFRWDLKGGAMEDGGLLRRNVGRR
ncbi:energy transducer TonB [Bdellovibrio bacteriovorus]|uniref:energy transducer TonB n=1 Tax=Bdellovibrio bacteriovorus TaxID=959 RepID=UPI0021D108FB|nr:energy transducer TonB [Bdellovibrio bacteriovorus]UXR65863.1 energy transducer TonB [Bdellovibrio bacteriovorus]